MATFSRPNNWGSSQEVPLPKLAGQISPVNMNGTFVRPLRWASAQEVPIPHLAFSTPALTPSVGVIPPKPLPGSSGGGAVTVGYAI